MVRMCSCACACTCPTLCLGTGPSQVVGKVRDRCEDDGERGGEHTLVSSAGHNGPQNAWSRSVLLHRAPHTPSPPLLRCPIPTSTATLPRPPARRWWRPAAPPSPRPAAAALAVCAGGGQQVSHVRGGAGSQSALWKDTTLHFTAGGRCVVQRVHLPSPAMAWHAVTSGWAHLAPPGLWEAGRSPCPCPCLLPPDVGL